MHKPIKDWTLDLELIGTWIQVKSIQNSKTKTQFVVILANSNYLNDFMSADCNGLPDV